MWSGKKNGFWKTVVAHPKGSWMLCMLHNAPGLIPHRSVDSKWFLNLRKHSSNDYWICSHNVYVRVSSLPVHEWCRWNAGKSFLPSCTLPPKTPPLCVGSLPLLWTHPNLFVGLRHPYGLKIKRWLGTSLRTWKQKGECHWGSNGRK